MELMRYTQNDDLASVGRKTDANFRRLATQMDQRIKVIMSEIDELRRRVDDMEGEDDEQEG